MLVALVNRLSFFSGTNAYRDMMRQSSPLEAFCFYGSNKMEWLILSNAFSWSKKKSETPSSVLFARSMMSLMLSALSFLFACHILLSGSHVQQLEELLSVLPINFVIILTSTFIKVISLLLNSIFLLFLCKKSSNRCIFRLGKAAWFTAFIKSQ